MILVRFVSADGTRVEEARGGPGDCLLDLAQAYGQPLEGTCEGQMACSTCHVIVAPEDADKLPPQSEEEEDKIELAATAPRTRRPASQLTLTYAAASEPATTPPGTADTRESGRRGARG